MWMLLCRDSEFCCIFPSRVFYTTINLIGLKHHILSFEWELKFQISFSFYLDSVHAWMVHVSARGLGRVYRQNLGLPLCGPVLLWDFRLIFQGLTIFVLWFSKPRKNTGFLSELVLSENIRSGLPANFTVFCMLNLSGTIYLYLNSSFWDSFRENLLVINSLSFCSSEMFLFHFPF